MFFLAQAQPQFRRIGFYFPLKKWHSPFIMTNPFFRKAEHCCGYVAEAPEVPESKSASNWCSLIFFYWFLRKRNEEQVSISLPWTWTKYIKEYQRGIAHYTHNQVPDSNPTGVLNHALETQPRYETPGELWHCDSHQMSEAAF